MEALQHDAAQTARRAGDSTWFDRAIRGGLVAYGLVYVVVAWLAIQLALGDRGGEASTSGAVRELAQQPFGQVLVWLVAIGMFALVLWRALEAATGHRDEEGATRVRKRVTSAAKGVLYAAIGISAIRVATGSGGGSGGGGGGGRSSEDTLTAKLLDLPFGQGLVFLVGLGIIGYGVALGIRAWTEKFREQLSAEGQSGDTGTAYLWLGKIGHAAKGVALSIVGGLFCYAAVTHDPKKSGGLDQALREVLDQPFGPVLLVLVGVGIGCYGLFSFARARHLSR
ncbi:DUF1206 domain-containing protein [Nocardioides marmotae]|uniref:DUF1206 domain-containing protein n=1 Tax=Nocardioides marmotae TaxID=2663857 RepID=UPI001658CADC|nr:DUF1206 domain-containing protein [Nocardioides marmotae]MBC9733608.1 DUF1206 domain-containing protein [Nocardioides marmotae]